MSENGAAGGGEPPEERGREDDGGEGLDAELEPELRAGSSRRLKILVVALLALPLLVAIPLLIWGQLNSGDGSGISGLQNLVFEEAAVLGPGPRNFEVETLDGETLTLEGLQGKWVVVDFWAPWCPPCVQEAPELAASYERWRFRGVEFIGVASFPRGDYESAVREFVEDERVPFPVALDNANSSLALNFGVTGLPEKFILTPDGELHSTKLVGPVTSERLDGVLEELVAGGS